MKKSIIYLGIALVAFTNFALAIDFQQSSNDENLNSAQTEESFESVDSNTDTAISINKNSITEGGEPASSALEAAGFKPYEKTMEEIIAENNQIIESADEIATDETNEIIICIDEAPLCREKSMEDIIFQDSMIIENAIEVNPTKIGKSKKV